jgi:sec-independent protein translocase protein TatB
MFDIGWGELVVIGIVALIAIGPKELPGVLRTMGQWMGKVRRMANEFQSQFNEALREAEFADLKKQADDLTNSVSDLGKMDPLADAQRQVEHAFETPPAEAHALGAPAGDAGNAPPAAAPQISSLPPIDVPPPEAPEPAKEPVKQSGGG